MLARCCCERVIPSTPLDDHPAFSRIQESSLSEIVENAHASGLVV